MKKRVKTFLSAMLLAFTLGGIAYVVSQTEEPLAQQAFEQKAPDMEHGISVLP